MTKLGCPTHLTPLPACQFHKMYVISVCDVLNLMSVVIISCLFCPVDLFFFTGSSPDDPKPRVDATKPERYGTTVPLLLKGKERRPLDQLAARVNAHKATADVWLFMFDITI